MNLSLEVEPFEIGWGEDQPELQAPEREAEVRCTEEVVIFNREFPLERGNYRDAFNIGSTPAHCTGTLKFVRVEGWLTKGHFESVMLESGGRSQPLHFQRRTTGSDGVHFFLEQTLSLPVPPGQKIFLKTRRSRKSVHGGIWTTAQIEMCCR